MTASRCLTPFVLVLVVVRLRGLLSTRSGLTVLKDTARSQRFHPQRVEYLQCLIQARNTQPKSRKDTGNDEGASTVFIHSDASEEERVSQ